MDPRFIFGKYGLKMVTVLDRIMMSTQEEMYDETVSTGSSVSLGRREDFINRLLKASL